MYAIFKFTRPYLKYIMLNMKHGMIFVIVIVGIFSFHQGTYAESPKTETLLNLVSEAVNNNPGVSETYESWRAAEYRVNQFMSLPDAKARYTFFGESVETKVGPEKYKIGASQTIPFPAKLGVRGKAQSRKARMLKEKHEAVKREVIKEVKFTYYDLFWVDKAIGIIEGEKSIVENLERVAQVRYESNLAPIQDSIKAQVEISKLIDRLLFLRQNRKSLEAKMISILSRPGKSVFGGVESVELTEFTYTKEALHSIAGESRQELLAAMLDVERAKFEKSLAQFDYMPDVTLGFEYIGVGDGYTTLSNDGQDAWMGSVAINVPIWLGRLDSKFKEKKASLESSKKRVKDIENRIYYEVEDIYFKTLAYKDVVLLYKTALVPQTEQGFEAARTAYETGKVDFLNWLDAEKTLLHTRLAYYKAIADYEKSIAYLERIVGRDL